MYMLLQGVIMREIHYNNHDLLTKPKIYTHNLSNDDILFLQDTFLTKGLHSISVDSLETGRALIYTIIQSLHYYEAIACLTMAHQPPLADPIINMYQDAYTRFGPSYTLDDIENMFLDYWSIECLWLERTRTSSQDALYGACTKAMHSLDMPEHIPVVQLVFA